MVFVSERYGTHCTVRDSLSPTEQYSTVMFLIGTGIPDNTNAHSRGADRRVDSASILGIVNAPAAWLPFLPFLKTN